LNKKFLLIAPVLILVLAPFMQSASACTEQDVSFYGKDIQFVPSGIKIDGNIFSYMAFGQGTMVGDVSGDFRWVEKATFYIGACGGLALGNVKIYLTITNDDGSLTIKSEMDIVYANGRPLISSATWTVVDGEGIYEDVSGDGTMPDYWAFDGELEYE
jgi:hypothetical protein